MAKLPCELITQILSLLPAKSLVRFQCVSKDWVSLFAQPYFLKLRALQQSQELILRDGHLYSLDCDSLDCALRVDHLLKNTDFTVKKVLGCSNGLVCLSVSSISSDSVVVAVEEKEETIEVDDDDDELEYYREFICTTDYIDDIIVICNISTGAHHIVPSSPIIFDENGSWMGTRCEFRRRFSYGFGFDPSGNDYKLVRISQYIYKLDPRCEDDIVSEINVYSMKTNSWTRVRQDMANYCIACKEPVLAGGVLYWIAFRRKGLRLHSWFQYDNPSIVLAFDIAHGVCSFREVPIHRLMEDQDCPKLCLGSLRGRLCAMSRGSAIDFFMKEDGGDSNSWNLMASLPYTLDLNFQFWYAKSISYFSYDKALAFSKSGCKVLVEQDKDNFVCCDLTKGTANKSQIHFISFQQPKKRILRN